MGKKDKTNTCSLRSPVCSVVGHVDHGKSSILDAVRGTAITTGEAGGITQAIGASIIPLSLIKKKCGKLLESMGMQFTIPGLLFIDTPGHAAFSNLRKRGGNLADIAVLVVDINDGFKPQTIESVEILKFYKTPFIIAANKVDMVSGWRSKDTPILKTINSQEPNVMTAIETKLYEIVGKLHEFGFPSERFDRIEDFTKEIAIVPVSAKTGEGLQELLMIITALAQKFLENCLTCNLAGNAKGTILEVKEEKGLGKTLDVIVYDGTLNVNDTIVIGNIGKPIVTKVRALFLPTTIADMRDKKSKFQSVKNICAATGVKVAAPDIQDVIAGMPIESCKKEDVEEVSKRIQAEVEEVMIETDKEGIIIKADTIGSLEALTTLLKEKGFSIRKAGIGDISKKDITDAESSLESHPLDSVILAFNIPVSDEMKNYGKNIKILNNDVIYRLIEEFEVWLDSEKKRIEAKELENLIRPCKMRVMTNHVFRQSNPAIVGCDILVGQISTGNPIMKNGQTLSHVKSIQHEKDNLTKVEAGKQVAISLPGVTVGRQISENDALYADVPEKDFRRLKALKKYLSKQEIEVLKELAEIKRKENALWGI